MHKISSHYKFVFVTEWHCVQPSYGKLKVNGFLHFFGDVCVWGGSSWGYWLVSSQGIVNSTVWHQCILLFVLVLHRKLLNKWEGYFHSDSTFHFLLAQSEHFCCALCVLCWYADVAASGAYVPLDGLFARSFYFNWDWTFVAFCCFFLRKSNSSNILVKCIWIYLTAL